MFFLYLNIGSTEYNKTLIKNSIQKILIKKSLKNIFIIFLFYIKKRILKNVIKTF